MRDHWVRDELGRFADIPGVGDDAPSRGHSGSSHVANSATTPGGTRTSIPSHESKAAPGNEFVARNRDKANREQAAKNAEYKASTTPEQRAADLDTFFGKFDSPSKPAIGSSDYTAPDSTVRVEDLKVGDDVNIQSQDGKLGSSGRIVKIHEYEGVIRITPEYGRQHVLGRGYGKATIHRNPPR